MSLPSAMKAVVIEGDKPVVKENIPLPELENGYMLVKPKAVAGNPTDWKHISYKIGPQGSILGCDVAGEVVKLGPGVDPEKFHVGDYVYGFVHGASVRFPTNGAFAEYVALDSGTAFKAPKTMKLSGQERISKGPVTTFEAAASLPVSITTAGVALHHEFGLKLDYTDSKPQRDFPVLFWGGATGVGQHLIQIAKQINGYSKIIVVASRKHEQMLKEYGADDLFDYHDADVIEQIKSKYPDIQHLVDCVSNTTTIQQTYKCASEDHEATVLQLVTLSIEDIKPEDRRDNKKIIGTMLYKAGGHDVPFGSFTIPADPEYRRDACEVVKFLNPKLDKGDIQHIPVKVYPNGLHDVPQIMDDIENNRNSGEKLVAVFQ